MMLRPSRVYEPLRMHVPDMLRRAAMAGPMRRVSAAVMVSTHCTMVRWSHTQPARASCGATPSLTLQARSHAWYTPRGPCRDSDDTTHGSVQAYRILDRGPPSDAVRPAAAFRKLWGDRAEMRRLPDASICEAVAWDWVPPAQRSSLPDIIVQHILQLHFPGAQVRAARCGLSCGEPCRRPQHRVAVQWRVVLAVLSVLTAHVQRGGDGGGCLSPGMLRLIASPPLPACMHEAHACREHPQRSHGQLHHSCSCHRGLSAAAALYGHPAAARSSVTGAKALPVGPAPL